MDEDMPKNKKPRIEELCLKTKREHRVSDKTCVYPLYLLRQYNIDNQEIIERDNQIIFGENSWPKDVKTNFAIHMPKHLRTNYNKPAENTMMEYYTLDCLLFFLKNINLHHPEYCKIAAAANTQAVRRPDRKNVLNYLNGVTDTCASIYKSAPMEKPTQVKDMHRNNEELEAGKPCIKDYNIKKEQEETYADPNARKDENAKALDEKTCVKVEQE